MSDNPDQHADAVRPLVEKMGEAYEKYMALRIQTDEACRAYNRCYDEVMIAKMRLRRGEQIDGEEGAQ